MAIVEPISEWFVRPNTEIEQSKKQQKPYDHYHLSPPDFFKLSVDHVHHGLLFAKPHSSSSSSSISPINSNFFENLRVTLSVALNDFYPLAGRLVTERYEDEHACCIFVDCNKGPGARLIRAVAPRITLMDVLAPNEDVPLLVQSFFDLGERAINYDGHSRPLLTVQVTELVNGVFMGFTMNRCIVDGTSAYFFLHSWSEIFTRYMSRSNDAGDNVIVPLSTLPNYKRPPIPNSYGSTIKLPYLDPNEFISQADNNGCKEEPIRERIFWFSPATIAILKAKAKAEYNNSNNNNNNKYNNIISISSHQALCALVWRSITRARNLSPLEETTCAFFINIRPRFKPPLSENYFGNYLTVAKGTVKVGELLDEHGLGLGSMILHKAIVAVDDKVARDALIPPFLEGHRRIQLPRQASYGPNPIAVGGSARFDPYRTEFGFGRAVAVRIGTANQATGAVVSYPGREGGRSVELTIRLVGRTMAALLSDEEFMSFITLSPKL